jgi:hypothetical protein
MSDFTLASLERLIFLAGLMANKTKADIIPRITTTTKISTIVKAF